MSDHVKEFMRLLDKIAIAEGSIENKSSHRFDRSPEPHAITSAPDSVNDYNQVLETNLTVNYAASLDIIHRAWEKPAAGSRSLDLCSGPGHLSLLQAEYLKIENVQGVDFSRPMIQVAEANVKSRGLEKTVRFEQGNILKLKTNGKVDLVTFTNAAHHLDSITDLNHVLEQAEGLLTSNGVIVLTDMARLANDEITREFVALAGKDYREKKMDAMYDDFLASMRAAWSPHELISAVPRSSGLNWFHLVSAGIPYFQALIAVPKSRSEVFVRESLDWTKLGLLKSKQAQQDWEMTKGSYYGGPLKKVS